jgi:ABC-type sugar transport system permease subunit
MQPQVAPYEAPPRAGGGVAARVVGWVLLVPALVLTVMTLVIPSVRTIAASFESRNLLPGGETEDVGFDNYDAVFGQLNFWSALGFALSLVVVPMVVAVVVAPLVAAALDWAGAWARWTARIVLSLTVVVFSPVAWSYARLLDLRDDPTRLASLDQAAGTVRSTTAMMTVGVVLAVGLMIFLPVFRARAERRPMWPALFAVAGVAVLGVVAVGLQQFTVPYVLTRFGPADLTTTPVGLMFMNAFTTMRLGVGAAVGTVLLALLAVLGIAAVLIIVLTRLRVSLVPLRRPPVPRKLNPGAIVLAVLVLAAVITSLVLNALPWFNALSGDEPPLSGTQGHTWGPAINGAVVSVGVAYLAALGISGLRPLGRHSEWLLMAFAPWLFVGLAPLSIEFFLSAQEDGSLNTEDALGPQILVSLVSLVIIALLCRGQAEQWQRQVAEGAPAGPTFVQTVLVPTLPLAGLLFVVTALLNAQDFLWPLLVSSDPDNDTAVLSLYRLTTEVSRNDVSVASATPLLAIVLGALAIAAAQVLHLDRMVATTGKPVSDAR